MVEGETVNLRLIDIRSIDEPEDADQRGCPLISYDKEHLDRSSKLVVRLARLSVCTLFARLCPHDARNIVMMQKVMEGLFKSPTVY